MNKRVWKINGRKSSKREREDFSWRLYRKTVEVNFNRDKGLGLSEIWNWDESKRHRPVISNYAPERYGPVTENINIHQKT